MLRISEALEASLPFFRVRTDKDRNMATEGGMIVDGAKLQKVLAMKQDTSDGCVSKDHVACW